VVRVKSCLDSGHSFNHVARLGVVKERRLLLTDAMLGTDATIHLANVVHHKWLYYVLSALLQAYIVVAGQNDVQMKVSVADMTVTVWLNFLLLFCVKLI